MSIFFTPFSFDAYRKIKIARSKRKATNADKKQKRASSLLKLTFIYFFFQQLVFAETLNCIHFSNPIPAIRACYNTYQVKQIEIEGYVLEEQAGRDGFFVQLYVNYEKRQIIVAMRGVSLAHSKSWHAGIALGCQSNTTYLMRSIIPSAVGVLTGGALGAATYFLKDGILEIFNKGSQNFVSFLGVGGVIGAILPNAFLLGSYYFVGRKVLADHENQLHEFIQRSHKKFPPQRFSYFFTGHSLGGHFAQIASLEYGAPGMIFNSPHFVKSLKHVLTHPFVSVRMRDDLPAIWDPNPAIGTSVIHHNKAGQSWTEAHSIGEVLEHFESGCTLDKCCHAY